MSPQCLQAGGQQKGFCQVSCQQASPAAGRVQVLSGRLQDGQHGGGFAEKTKSAVIGRNMLVVAGPRAEEIAQLIGRGSKPGHTRSRVGVEGIASAVMQITLDQNESERR